MTVVFPKETLLCKGGDCLLKWILCECLPNFAHKYSLCSLYLHSALQGPSPWHHSVL